MRVGVALTFMGGVVGRPYLSSVGDRYRWRQQLRFKWQGGQCYVGYFCVIGVYGEFYFCCFSRDHCGLINKFFS